MQRSPAATEAMYLMMKQAFELGYRRYEWKCDALNAGSRAAAERLGLRSRDLPPGGGSSRAATGTRPGTRSSTGSGQRFTPLSALGSTRRISTPTVASGGASANCATPVRIASDTRRRTDPMAPHRDRWPASTRRIRFRRSLPRSADFQAPDAWPGLTRGDAMLEAVAGINLPAAGFVQEAPLAATRAGAADLVLGAAVGPG